MTFKDKKDIYVITTKHTGRLCEKTKKKDGAASKKGRNLHAKLLTAALRAR